MTNRTVAAGIRLYAAQLYSAPPCLPDYVRAYFGGAGLSQRLPQGHIEAYLADYLEETDQPEPWAIVGDFNGDGIQIGVMSSRPEVSRGFQRMARSQIFLSRSRIQAFNSSISKSPASCIISAEVSLMSLGPATSASRNIREHRWI